MFQFPTFINTMFPKKENYILSDKLIHVKNLNFLNQRMPRNPPNQKRFYPNLKYSKLR